MQPETLVHHRTAIEDVRTAHTPTTPSEARALRLRCLELALGEAQGRSAGWPNIVNAAAAYEAFVLTGKLSGGFLQPVGDLVGAGRMVAGGALSSKDNAPDHYWPNRFPDDVLSTRKPARQKAPAKPKRAKR